MSKQVKILSGVSGSGKSTLAGKLLRDHQGGSWVLVSADAYFLVDEDGNRGFCDGSYKFEASKLSEAHAFCFRNFIEALQPSPTGAFESAALVIVDNTNTTAEEIAPYVLGAQAFGYEHEIITLMPDTSKVSVETFLDRCAYRNKHGVPLSVISNQYRRLSSRRLPAYWKVSGKLTD